MIFFLLPIFFKINSLRKNSFRKSIRVSNSLNPDQARHFVEPDLESNCLQRLSADDKIGRWQGKFLKIDISDNSIRQELVKSFKD